MFIIKDWASNVLQHDGKFNYSKYGQDIGAPMQFEFFDDAWEYIYERYDESYYEEFFVEPLEKLN